EVLKTQAMGCLFSQNGSGYGFAFFIIADRADHFDFLARFIFRENNLFELIPVVGDDAVGRVDDVLGGTVILFQFEYFQVGVILLKIQDVLDIRPAEGVNALCIVPHHADVLVNRCQTLDNQVLREIGVLVLVHHNVPEFMLVLMKGLGMVPEQDVGFEQQVVEIHGACLVTAVNISLVNLTQPFPARRDVIRLDLGVLHVFADRNQVVLCRGNPLIHKIGVVQLVIQHQLFQDGLNQAFAVIGVVNRKI